MIKVIKLSKKDYTDLEGLLKKAGLVDEEAGRAFPERLLVSKEDAKKMRSQILKALKKKYPFFRQEKLQASAGMYFLNLGPSEVAADAVRPGYAIVISRKQEPDEHL